MDNLDAIIGILSDILQDRIVPRNIKQAVLEAKVHLEDKEKELDVKTSSAISILDEITNDPNIPMHTRTQIWNIVSMLEMIKGGS
ncbi:hypothetical protein A3K63_03355 [Candidatus Micrarchaeota archaeon RBG_16_49_10]|nr:MAG: hypothetical protein A3K63_03355 [Candidatus Micrarchaeota archaeon RBG_16_49_10]